MKTSIQFAILASLATTPAVSQEPVSPNASSTANSGVIHADPDVSVDNGASDNWEFTENGRRLWTCATAAVDLTQYFPDFATHNMNVAGKKIYETTQGAVEGDSTLKVSTLAIFDPVKEGIQFTSIATISSESGPNEASAYSIKTAFDNEAKIVERHSVDGNELLNKTAKSNAELAQAYFSMCAPLVR